MCKMIKDFGTAIILAGGKSSRMGFDKQFLKIGKKRILEDIISKLENEFEEIIIVTNKPKEYSDFKCKIVTDIIVGKGPLSGLHVGLKNSSSKYSYLLACDMPNINLDYIKYMKAKIEKDSPKACVSILNEKVEVFNGFYSKELYYEVEESLKEGKRSVHRLLHSVKTIYIEENEVRKYNKPNMFINLNTQIELENYINNIDYKE